MVLGLLDHNHSKCSVSSTNVSRSDRCVAGTAACDDCGRVALVLVCV